MFFLLNDLAKTLKMVVNYSIIKTDIVSQKKGAAESIWYEGEVHRSS